MKSILNIILLFIALNLKAQQSIEILNADTTFGNIKKHADYWRLVGNVKFKYNNTIMYCDSAHHFTKKEQINAFGEIKIFQGDTLTITAKKLTYYGEKKIANLSKNVILKDKYMRLYTEYLSYNINSNIASFSNYAKIIENEKTITSKKGQYNANLHNYIFKDSVIIFSKDYNITTENMHYNTNNGIASFFGPSNIVSKTKNIYCENGWYNTRNDNAQFKNNAIINTNKYILKGDSMFYNKKLGYGKALENVEIINKSKKIKLFGEIGEYFENKNYIEIRENTLLEMLIDEDTLFMHATKFINHQLEEEEYVIAQKNIKFFSKNLQGKCDSLTYNLTKSEIEMFVKPIIWVNNFQITSDTMQFIINNNNIEKLYLVNNPLIISEKDSLDYNQIKGKNMTVCFSKNKIQKIDVQGNGQSIFIVNDEKNNEKIAINYIECSNLSLNFKDQKIDKINYKIKPNSITTPYQNLNEKNRYLKGFNWRKKEQPTGKKDLFKK